jgi:hypothetical protein
MGVFKLPANLCQDLIRMIRYFWWGEDGEQQKDTLACMEEIVAAQMLPGFRIPRFVPVQPSHVSATSMATYPIHRQLVCAVTES